MGRFDSARANVAIASLRRREIMSMNAIAASAIAAPEGARAVGDREAAGLHVLEVDVVEAGAHDLPDARVGRGVHHLGSADRASRVDHDLNPLELRRHRAIVIEDRQVVAISHRRDQVLLAVAPPAGLGQEEHLDSPQFGPPFSLPRFAGSTDSSEDIIYAIMTA